MDSRTRLINADHKFSAPKLLNYSKGDTEEHMNKALLEETLTSAPLNSTSRTTGIQSLRELRPQHLKINNSKKEQLEKTPKFKARPVNKKILESKGELGMLCNKKRQVTIPQEFHFAIDERIPPQRTTNGVDLFNKIALCLKSHNKKLIPRKTIPRPFHFQTEERRAQKESKSMVKILHKQMEEGSSNEVTKSKPPRLSGLVMKERRRKLAKLKTYITKMSNWKVA